MQRHKGQETSLVFIRNGEILETLTNCKSLEFEYKLEILQEGYLGETTDQYDSVFKGISGNADFHFSDATPLILTEDMVNKARRREGGTKVNIKTTFNYPNGRRAIVTFRDVEFGAASTTVGGRSEFSVFKTNWSCSDGQVQLA